MSFNHQWHPIEIAKLWPVGSVVLFRYKLKSKSHHEYLYTLSSNWSGDAANVFLKDYQFQLIEEPNKQ